MSSRINICKHSIILVYPFLHTMNRKDRNRRLQRASSLWGHWWNRFDDRQLLAVLDDSYFFLPNIRSLLFPETSELGELDPSDQLAQALAMRNRPLKHYFDRYHSSGMIRLTLQPSAMEQFRQGDLSFELRNENDVVIDSYSAPFLIDWVDVAFFPNQLGFLMIKVRIDEEGIPLDRLIDFLYHCRLVHPPTLGWKLASWRYRQTNLSWESRDLVDFFLQGFSDTYLTIEKDPLNYLQSRKKNQKNRFTSSEFGQIYGQNFFLFVFACLDGLDGNGRRIDDCLFKTQSEKILYELATHSNMSDPNYQPDADYVHSIFASSKIALWRNWQGLALQNNVVFLGLENTRFTMTVLRHNVENDYFFLYLFTLFQKIWLNYMSSKITIREKRIINKIKGARALFDRFIYFQNNYWFHEVTRKPIGMEIYHCFRAGLKLESTYSSLHEQVYEIRAYFESGYQRLTSYFISLLTLIFVPLSAIFSLFSGPLIQEPTWNLFVKIIGAFYFVASIVWLIIRFRKKI